MTASFKDRVYTTRGPHPFLRPHTVSGNGRPTKYKQYPDREMKFSRAIKEVEEGTLSIRRAALEYGIPRATLHDRISGKVQA